MSASSSMFCGTRRARRNFPPSPNGRIPVPALEDGTCIAESNAILHYLAEGSRFLPSGRLDRALILQRMFFEQYSHEPNTAVARHWIRHVEMTGARRAQLPAKQEGGNAALAVMERHLGGADWFGGEAITVANIALCAYTHVAEEGGFDLGLYPAAGAWLGRVARARPCPDASRTEGSRRSGRPAGMSSGTVPPFMHPLCGADPATPIRVPCASGGVVPRASPRVALLLLSPPPSWPAFAAMTGKTARGSSARWAAVKRRYKPPSERLLQAAAGRMPPESGRRAAPPQKISAIAVSRLAESLFRAFNSADPCQKEP